MALRTQALSPKFTDALQSMLGETSPDTLARAVLKLSDFYLENPGQHTPWKEDFAAQAYLSYYLPLNLARVQDVLRDLHRFIPRESLRDVWDFGSGLGTTHFALEGLDWKPGAVHALERSPLALDMYQKLIQKLQPRWQADFNLRVQPEGGDLAVFSYSFLEMQDDLPDLKKFDHLLIIEPSTRERGRELMQWRAKLMEQGFNPLAPCTHSEPCPMLTHSPKDWCHIRVHFDAPEWFSELEAYLPMKNRTLTYSYLLMSRTVTDSKWRGEARVIGDTLIEAGKTRQMICRSSKREFLSWLRKKGDAPMISSGALLRGVDKAEVKGGGLELRPELGSLTWEE